MSKKKKSPVRRDEDFEELDQELEAAMRALESINEQTATVLQRVEQGADPASESPPLEEGGAVEPEPTGEPQAAAEA